MEPIEALTNGLSSLLKTGDYSDFTIICGPHTFNVHRAVICAQSEYFRAACGKFKEGETRTITLKATGLDDNDEACDDPEAIEALIHFLYHLDYRGPGVPVRSEEDWQAAVRSSEVHVFTPGSADDERSIDGNLVFHAKVFAAAVKYQILALQSISAAKFTGVVEIIRDSRLLSAAAHIIYTTTPEENRELRDAVVHTLHKHSYLLKKPEVEAVVRSTDGLCFQLLCKSQEQNAAHREREAYISKNLRKKAQMSSFMGLVHDGDIAVDG